MLFKESADIENLYLDMVLLQKGDDNQPARRQKLRQSIEGTHFSEPQKAFPIGESVIVE